MVAYENSSDVLSVKRGVEFNSEKFLESMNDPSILVCILFSEVASGKIRP